MNKIKISIYVAGMAFLGLFSCEKELEKIVTEQTNLENKAGVKFANFVIGSTRNYMFVDNAPVSGSASAYTTIYPSSSPSFMMLDAGSRAINIRDTFPTTTQVPVNITTNLEAGSYYTVFTYDSITNAKSVVVKDNLITPTDTTARIRFAHLAYSTAAIPNVDVWSNRRGANIFTNISPKAVTDFIPFAAAVNDTLVVRETGRTVNLAVLNGFAPITKRSYTVVFRGSLRTATGTVGRQVSTFLSY